MSNAMHESIITRKKYRTRFYVFSTLLLFSLIYVIVYNSDQIHDNLIVENNIQKVDNERILSIAASMNKPEWDDILIEVAEWAGVGVVTYVSAGWLAQFAVYIKSLRTANKVKKVAVATEKSYTFTNKVIKPFYKSIARPFTKPAVSIQPMTTGVYLFFNKHGKVKYVGKADNLRKRLREHLTGAPPGNPVLGQNAKKLSFVAIPIKGVGNNSAAARCVEAIAIKAFNNEGLYNKKIEKINKIDCQKLVRL